MATVSSAMPWLSQRLGPGFFFGTMAIVCAVGGMLWGRALAPAADPSRRASCGLGGAIGFATAAPAAASTLTGAETFLLERAMAGGEHAMHLAFGALFTAAMLVVTVFAVLGVAIGAGQARQAARLSLRCGAVAATAFLIVAVAFDLAGWRVGAPGAEERFTMVVVTLVGFLVSSYAAGSLVARSLAAGALSPGAGATGFNAGQHVVQQDGQMPVGS